MLSSTHTSLTKCQVQASLFTTSVVKGFYKPAVSMGAKSSVNYQPKSVMRNTPFVSFPHKFNVGKTMASNSLSMSASSFSFGSRVIPADRNSESSKIMMFGGEICKK